MKGANGIWSYLNAKLLLLLLILILPSLSIADEKQDSVVTGFYNNYVSALIGDKDCRNLRTSIDDTFLIEFPDAMDSDEGTFMTNATPNTSLYFQVKSGKVVSFSVENGLMVTPSNNDIETSYFCIISAAQSALYSKVNRGEINKNTKSLYVLYRTNKQASEERELYKHSFTVDEANLVYKFVRKG